MALTLNDVCSAIVDCEHKTAPTQSEGYPSIRTPNIGRGRLILEGVNRVSDDIYRQWTQRMEPTAGDLILAREAPIGNVALIPKGLKVCLGQRTVLIRADRTKVLPEYLVYLMLGDEIQGRIHSQSNGATVHHLNMKDIRGLALPSLPSIEEQSRIASLLSAYDDLIENNTRRIAILEEMAKRTYEAWFVRFRFPGHESVSMIQSELGLVPEAWPVVPASAAIGVNPSTKVSKEGLKPFLAMNCLSDRSMLIDNRSEREGNSGSKFRNGDTLFARITPCLENGKTGFVQFLSNDEATGFGSTEFIVLRSQTLTPEYVYLLARSDTFRDNAIKSMSGASGRQRVREACFDTFLLPNPDLETLAKFKAVVRPMFKLIQTLALENANLRTTRDLLLPKLISAELDVSTLPEPEALAA